MNLKIVINSFDLTAMALKGRFLAVFFLVMSPKKPRIVQTEVGS
jgi:hypothetical protein